MSGRRSRQWIFRELSKLPGSASYSASAGPPLPLTVIAVPGCIVSSEAIDTFNRAETVAAQAQWAALRARSALFQALIAAGRPKQTDSSRIVRHDMQAGDACLRLG
jgi:hypothetical protein